MRNCFLFLFGLLAFSCKNGTEKTSQDNEVEKSLSTGQVKLVYDNIKAFPNSTEFSIAVINRDGTKYYDGRWKKDTIEHVDNSEHLFEVGSITKEKASKTFSFLCRNQSSSYIMRIIMFQKRNLM